ncbi:P-loop containing nucleoside triphosphate hydrolase protein [Tricharina praecox]|uniref:P-loop containing nucleoside triphosphate hydrolase protein n=1 Tax=Tricharina praecox TaxID=43433 RepID=UPI00221FDA96|nr:P-loop containing nucleoside triphosphate hydrolase protein [Tricharina praecox]KAI5857850.1 P-loop containing nucleoside triphosphate hydrolase protein [Tricharina praecox]
MSSAMALPSTAARSSSPLPPAAKKAPSVALQKRPKNRSPTVARFIVDELRGDAGFVSEDIWRDVFGFQKKAVVADRKLEDIDLNEEVEDEPLPPTLYIAIAPLASAASVKKWTILPVTLMPTSSQFPSLPPNTVLIPDSMNMGALESVRLPNKRPVGVLVTAVNPTYLDTVIVNVRTVPGINSPETDHDIEDRVKDALSKLKVIHSGEVLRLSYGRAVVGRTARIALTEPVNQGFLKPDTKVVVVKEQARRRRRGGLAGASGVILAGGDMEESDASADSLVLSDDDEDEDALEFSTFLTAPSTTTSVSFPSISPTPTLMRNGIASPNSNGPMPKSAGRVFQPQPLTSPVPPGYLHPKPREGDDDEARVFVKVGDLAKLGCFSGDWIKISVAATSSDDISTSPLRTAAESVARGQNFRPQSSGGSVRNGSRGFPARDESGVHNEEKEQIPGRPVRVFSLPESWEAATNTSKSPKGKGKVFSIGGADGRIVYLSPVLLANLLPDNSTADLLLSPLPTTAPAVSSVLHSQAPAFPPPAKEVTLLRIASPTSTDRALQPSLLLQLKSYFESCRRLVKKGDLIAVSIDEVLARSLYGEVSEDGVTEELLASTDAGRKNCVAWFRVGSIVSSAADEGDGKDGRSSSRRGDVKQSGEEGDVWEGVVFVDPASTRMVQAGSEKRKIPPTIHSTWENYLGLRPPPLREATVLGRPVQITMPERFVSQTHRRLRELIAAATSPRAIKMNLQPLAILVTSTQRDIGKRTLARAAAADVGVHVFHIDAYDIIADGGAGDTKTEAFLRARVDRALSCGKETCVLLISHVEALTAGRMGEVLKDIVADMKIVVATTTEVDKLSDTVRNVFTHELEVNAPDEKERAALLSAIVDEKKIRVASDVALSAIAVKTAALVAGDLADVLDRAVAASKSRVAALAKRLKKTSPPCPSHEIPTIQDLQFAGGDAVTSVCRVDFDVAVEAARRNFSDSIGAPRIPNVSWDDVGGLANVKYAVMETIQLPLERPELFAKGMKKRSGILFYGPPGTGKTLLAKAIATEFSLNFFSIKGPELLNMYIGESEANVRRVFQRARDARPCVVFFDELDSVAPKRGNQGDSGGVMDRIVSQLLAELDGMSEGKEGSGGVFVIGATNRPDLLDPALLRPGRFDKMLYLGVSDSHEKQLTILEALTRKFAIEDGCNLMKVAETLPFTYTGADLYALCSDAMLKAITKQARYVDEQIRNMEQRGEGKVSTAWWFDNVATEDDVKVVVRADDFDEARRELVGSVSAKELEHYQRVRAQFEQPDPKPEKEEKEDKGKGKAANYPDSDDDDEKPTYTTGGKGKGKAVMLEQDGHEREFRPNGWEDPAGNDDDELYGE